MTFMQLAHLRRQLTRKLTELFQTVNHDLHEAIVERVYGQEDPVDEADDAERNQLRDLQHRLDERSGQLAIAIEEALDRMASGSYGRCADCGRAIELERLELVPWAERCADDQRRYEQQRGEHHATL